MMMLIAGSLRGTVAVLLGGLSLVLAAVGLLGTLLGLRGNLEAFNGVTIGAIMAAYYAGYIIGTQFGPLVIANVGHIRAFAVFAALAASTSLAFSLWVDPLGWAALRLLNGIAMVGIFMVVESWLNAQTPVGLRGRVFATYMISTLLALGAGQFIILSYDPAGSELFALVTLLTILGLIPIAITRMTEPVIEAPQAMGLKRLFRVSPLGTLGAFGAGLVNGLFWGLTPVFAQRLDMSTEQIALLMSAVIAGGALLQYPIGLLSDRYDRRTVLVLVSLSAAALAGSVAGLVWSHVPGLFVVSFLYGGLMFAIYGLAVAHTNDRLTTGHTLSATQGLLLVYGVGAFLGPLLGGVALREIGPVGVPLIAALVLAGIALFGLLRSVQREAPPADEQTDYIAMVRTTPVVLEMHPEAEREPELDLDFPPPGQEG